MNIGYVINNAQFRPFSYNELIAPLQQQTDYQNALEDQISQLGAQADAIGSMANQETDPQAYAQYKAYSNALRQQANSLLQNGLTPGSRSILNNLRQSYSTDIIPIQNAISRRREFEDEQRKLSLQDPTRIWQRQASGISLDELITNPNMDYGQSYSGALISQMASQAAANLAKEAQNSAAGRAKLKQLLPYQYEYMRQLGFTSDAVMKAIQDSPNASKILTGLVDNVVKTTGIQNWNDPVALEKAYTYARQGLWNAVGTTQSQMITDEWGLAKAKAALDWEYKKKELQLQTQQQAAMQYPDLPSYTRDITTPQQAVNMDEIRNVTGIDPRYNSIHDINVVINKVPSSDGTAGPLATIPHSSGNYLVTKKFRLWGKNGYMLTKQQFMNQGKNKSEKEALSAAYDKAMNTLGKYGFNKHTVGYNSGYIVKKFRQMGASSTTVNDLPLSNTDLQTVTRRVQNNAGNSIREFRGFNRDGSPILGKQAKESELFSKEKNGKYNNITGYMSPSYPSAKGTGFIMQDSNGKLYWISGNKISNSTPVNQQQVRKALDELDRDRRTTGMTDEQYKIIKAQIIAGGVRNDVIQLGGTYAPPSTDMVNSNANKEP